MKRIFFSGLLGTALFIPAVQAQTVEPKPESAVVSAAVTGVDVQAKKNAPWQLRISKDGTTLIQLAAKEAPLSDVAQDLSQQLGVPVRLSSLMENQRVNAELKDASVETAMRSLAPQVYLDEIINLPDASQRELLAIYLFGVNEASPARLASLKEQSETMLFVGNIGEEGKAAVAPEENPLQVTSNRQLLSVRARRQPVAVVLYEIAQQLGLSFEMRNDNNQGGNQLVDLEIQDQRLEDVLRQLPVPVQLMRRMNLSQGESEPLRIILLAQNEN